MQSNRARYLFSTPNFDLAQFTSSFSYKNSSTFKVCYVYSKYPFFTLCDSKAICRIMTMAVYPNLIIICTLEGPKNKINYLRDTDLFIHSHEAAHSVLWTIYHFLHCHTGIDCSFTFKTGQLFYTQTLFTCIIIKYKVILANYLNI